MPAILDFLCFVFWGIVLRTSITGSALIWPSIKMHRRLGPRLIRTKDRSWRSQKSEVFTIATNAVPLKTHGRDRPTHRAAAIRTAVTQVPGQKCPTPHSHAHSSRSEIDFASHPTPATNTYPPPETGIASRQSKTAFLPTTGHHDVFAAEELLLLRSRFYDVDVVSHVTEGRNDWGLGLASQCVPGSWSLWPANLQGPWDWSPCHQILASSGWA